jgi:predicted enzyme related to lactoylglutathione lyase
MLEYPLDRYQAIAGSTYCWTEVRMPVPNLFLIYVKDVGRSTQFYRELFEIDPVMETPRYVPFEIAPGVLFAIWSGGGAEVTPSTPRSAELGVMLPGGALAIDELFQTWVAKGAGIVEEPHDDVFGRTFVVSDPDGNLIRASPTD